MIHSIEHPSFRRVQRISGAQRLLLLLLPRPTANARDLVRNVDGGRGFTQPLSKITIGISLSGNLD